MKTTGKTLLALLSVPLLAGCSQKLTERPLPEETARMINFSITASPDQPQDSKVDLVEEGEGGHLEWQGDESLSILFGGNSSTTVATGLQVSIPTVEGKPGHFAGEASLGSWTLADVQGVVVPASLGSYYNYRSGAKNIVLTLPATQKQLLSGKMNPANVPFFAPLSGAEDVFTEDEGTYTLAGLSLQWGCGLVRFNIYLDGEAPEGMQADEVFKSISIVTSNAHLVGECRYNKAGSNAGTFSFSGSSPATVELEEEVLLSGHTKTNGIVLYLAVLPRNNGTSASTRPTYIERITIQSDKAVYNYTPATHVAVLTSTGTVNRLGINLAKFTRSLPVMYSTDGGATWMEDAPAAAFSSLAVKTPAGASLTADVLSGIATLVGTQSAVDLDLSQCTYESNVFPAVFGNATASLANKSIRSIVFPSNVTVTAAGAFRNCTGLKEVNLEGLTALSQTYNTSPYCYYAFENTALEHLTIPASISSYMDRSFVNCKSLTDIRYEASWSPASGYNYRTFQWGEGTAATNQTHTRDLTLTFGPNVKNTPQSGFYCNNNLTTVIFEGDNTVIMNQSFYGCRYLSTIELKGGVPPKINNVNVYTNMGASVTGAKKVIIPAGATATYTSHANWPAWEAMMSALGYTLEEAASLPEEDGYVVLAYANATTYRLAYAPGLGENAGLFATALKSACGASFAASEASATNAVTYEIVIGNPESRSECAAALEGIANGFIIKTSGDKVLIAGTDEGWSSLALEAFHERVLKNSAYAGAGFLKIPADFSYSENEENPQLIARFLNEGREFGTWPTLVGDVSYSSTIRVAQGAASDGTYAYFLLRNSDDSIENGCKVLKYSLSPFQKVGETAFFTGHHANDMTFDTKNGRALVVHGTGAPSVLSAIDGNTLAVSDIDIDPVLLGGMTYSPTRNLYAITRGGTLYKTLDENFQLVSDFGRTDSTGYTAQGMGSDDSYVYFPMSKTGTDNVLVAYSWDGSYAATIHVPVTLESESMFHASGKYYVFFYNSGSKCGTLYTVAPVPVCNFD